MALPAVSVAQMRAWEQASWDAGCSQSEVIATAGAQVAQVALRLTKPGDYILILAGKGHNGDDARCSRLHLPERHVELLSVSHPTQQSGDLEKLLTRRPALVVDGLFGIGLNRPLDLSWTLLIERINKANLRILALDVPSGLNAETGEPEGAAISAEITVTLGAPKKGLLAASAYPFVGRLEVAGEIGLIPCPFESDVYWTEPSDFEEYPPRRRVDGHKGTYGHVVIVAGSEGYHGAAVLAARGALRARPGLVTVLCDPSVYIPVASQLQAAMVHPFKENAPLPPSCSALVIGPGLADATPDTGWRHFLNHQWQTSPLPVVVDASALDWIDKGATPLNSRRVITPHPGEAARLLGTKSASVQSDRPKAVRDLSAQYGNCWVVLKGHQTLVGRSTGEIYVNPSGNPELAQGGAGDVLAGSIGGLLAQNRLQAPPLKTIRYAVWKHGEAADRLSSGRGAWTIEDLLCALGDPA